MAQFTHANARFGIPSEPDCHVRRTWPVRTRKRKSWPRSSNSCATRSASPPWARKSRRAFCSSALRAPAKRCSPAQSPGKPGYRSCRSPALTLWSCTSASARAACATCSSRPRRSRPAIVFIDEIDAVGRRRGAGLGGGHDEREQTLNQLLVEMDGFSANEGVIVIAATNRQDILDPALLRPGRFDRQIYVGRPDWRGREAILKVHSTQQAAGRQRRSCIAIAKATAGFTGADLANLLERGRAPCGDARAAASSRMKDLEDAHDQGHRRPGEAQPRRLGARDKSSLPYHEAGHAITHVRPADAGPRPPDHASSRAARRAA